MSPAHIAATANSKGIILIKLSENFVVILFLNGE
ncbi:hypothetical protein YPC_2003 [Yersinia pestis biovar Medievalis str. Harbin 35]|nr:hypothetical protein YPC_2003 [Yersinia pestis biovar Medievalis str. Harbin 35]EEO80572.1 hypothetical protein YPF_2891 [Yersinia pestis biovar Orientalis str. India 195]EEO84308.1 hypothetical protein YPH_0116 [Yersinia pestis biovar Orientalis str. PEXU2]EEO89965.1 hypothetical protein YPS_2839 [Yersinia pestis Pestoides A]